MTKKTSTILFIGLFSLGLVLLFILIAKTGFSFVASSLKKADVIPLLIGLLLYFISINIRAMKWYTLLPSKRDMPRKKFVLSYYLIYFLGNLTPAKFGEVSGPFILKKTCKLEIPSGLNIIIIDRLIEGVIFILFVFLSTIFLIIKKTTIIPHQTAFVAILFLFFLFFLIYILKNIDKIIVVLSTLLKRFKKNGSYNKIWQGIERFNEAKKELWNNKANIYKAFFLTICCWICDFLALFLIILSITKVALLDSIAAQTSSIFLSLISFIPGGIGIGAVTYVSILSSIGYSYNILVSAAVLNTVIVNTLRISLGLGSYLTLFRKP